MDNRIVALAFRHRWKKHINAWVSKDQRGFLPKRCMLANVIQMEALALSTAATHKEGAAILIDFKAAFPSISHDYLHSCLREVGFPPVPSRLSNTCTKTATASSPWEETYGRASRWNPAYDKAALSPPCYLQW